MASQQSQSPSLTSPSMHNEPDAASTAQNATQPSSPSASNTTPSTQQETTESSASTSTSTPPSPKQCSHCKTPTSESKPLKPCTKCHTILYCSRDCQKAAWKTHKKTCAEDAQRYALANPVKPASAPRVPKHEGRRGGLGKWQFDT